MEVEKILKVKAVWNCYWVCHLPICHNYVITQYVLPATRHKWTHHALTPARHAGTLFSIYLPQRDGRLS